MSEKKILTLRLKRKWWDLIKSGEKTVELRRCNTYWRRRLVGREYDEIHLWLGYPKSTDTEKLIVRKWTNVAKEMVQSDEFGPEPVECFCIDVSQEVSQ